MTFFNVLSQLNYESQLSDGIGVFSDQTNHYWIATQLQLLGTKFIESDKKPVLVLLST